MMSILFYKEKLLTPAQLKRLGEHKYNHTNSSLLDPYLQPYWNWLVSKVPIWLAPNLITVLGLIVNILTTLVLIWYSPDAKIEAPRWACLLCAIGLFIYQSLDAIDGKQARLTGTATPLGELFDHGCDSISTVFVAVSACISVQLGFYPLWMFFQCFCAMSLFYAAHWQAYVSGMLRFGKIDVTEAQLTIILIHIISAIFGPNIWATKIPYINFELRILILVATIFGGSIALYQCSVVVCTGGVGKNGSTVAGTSVLSPIIPLGMVVGPAFIIYRKSIQNVYEKHPVLYIMAFGMVAAKVTNRLVVAHMTKHELGYLDASMIGPAMLFLNQYFNFYFPEYVILWLCLVWASVDLVRYSAHICLEICDYLKIELFRIPVKSSRDQNFHHSSTNEDKNGMDSSSSHNNRVQRIRTPRKTVHH